MMKNNNSSNIDCKMMLLLGVSQKRHKNQINKKDMTLFVRSSVIIWNGQKFIFSYRINKFLLANLYC